MNNTLTNLCNFIHEAQKERGCVSLFLRNKSGQYSEAMEKQFLVVDELSHMLGNLPKKQSACIEPLLHAIRYLPTRRKYIISRMVEPSEAIAFYGRDIVSPAIELVQELAVFDQSNNPAKVSAFVNFLYWKERVGIERALGTQFVNLDWAETTGFRHRLEYIISEQQAYERMFLALTDDDGRKTIEALEKENGTFKRIEMINEHLTNGNAQQLTKTITEKEWFDLFTAKMDLLHEVGKTFAENLAIFEEAKANTKNRANLTTNKENSDLDGSVRSQMSAIEIIPLFSGIKTPALLDILKHARIVSHNKGAMVFLQGEQASRFYIILEGCVKIYKGNLDGEESILQIMTSGESLLETVIFNNSPFPVTAQAVDRVKLLSIPASIIREKLQTNKELAINMLATVAERSQALITQFEQLTLKTVTQRVGWFLLKLYLENGESSNNLKLPYDKSLIAGYLGMKPETFSRTLQSLKEIGIDIEKSQISLIDSLVLCSFCDMELSPRCLRSGTKICPNRDYAIKPN